MEALEKGYRIDVFSERSCSGLLVSILEAFEELGLEVVDANVSCSESFHLEAVAGDVRTTSLYIFPPIAQSIYLFLLKNK